MSYKVEYHIISGRVVETRQCRLAGRPGEKSRARRAPRRAGSSSEKKIRRNESEAVKRLARTINCNFGRGDIHVVRKYSADTLPESREEAEKGFEKLIRKVRDIYRKETGKSLKYIWTVSDRDPKTGKKVRLHVHAVMNKVAYEILLGLIDEKDELEYSFLDNRGDHTALAVYMIGNGKSDEANRKKWRSSRGLEKPIFTDPEVIEEIHEIRAPAGAEIRENVLTLDEETGEASAYLRYVLPEKPKVKGSRVLLPKPPKRGGKKRE